MATVVYDDYGRTSDDPDFGSRSETPEPYIVDAAGVGVIYICFADTTTRCVRRITEADGATTVEFAIGNWENRANLTYHAGNLGISCIEIRYFGKW